MKALFIIAEVILYFAAIEVISWLFSVFIDPIWNLSLTNRAIEHFLIGFIGGIPLLGLGILAYIKVYE